MRENGSLRNQFSHTFGRKCATQKPPKIERGANRRALFWAPGMSRICGQIVAKLGFSPTRFLTLRSHRLIAIAPGASRRGVFLKSTFFYEFSVFILKSMFWRAAPNNANIRDGARAPARMLQEFCAALQTSTSE